MCDLVGTAVITEVMPLAKEGKWIGIPNIYVLEAEGRYAPRRPQGASIWQSFHATSHTRVARHGLMNPIWSFVLRVLSLAFWVWCSSFYFQSLSFSLQFGVQSCKFAVGGFDFGVLDFEFWIWSFECESLSFGFWCPFWFFFGVEFEL